MQDHRDDSIWKTLAVAFGDGLAFGAGVNLSQSAATRISAGRSPHPDMRRLAARLGEIEHRMERAKQTNALPGAANQRVAEAVVSVVDARLREHSAQIEQRLAAIEAKISDRATAAEVAALRSDFNGQMAASIKRNEEDVHILRNQMAVLHRQFAESVARLVDEQISSTLDVRLAPMEKQLKEEIRQQTGRAVSLVASATDEYLSERIEPLQTEAAELRQRIAANDQNTLELVLALGQLCLVTAERLSPPEVKEPEFREKAAEEAVVPAASAGAPHVAGPVTVIRPRAAADRFAPDFAVSGADVAEPVPAEPISAAPIAPEPGAVVLPQVPAAAPEPAPLAPAFTQAQPATRLWRIPMVSSFLFVTGGLLLLHYL
jgi:hypothetical protein